MEVSEYQKMSKRELKNFWHVGRREILADTLNQFYKEPNKRKVLDVGCGTGGNLALLRNYGEVTGVDFSTEALKFARMSDFKDLVRASAVAMPLTSNSYDLAAALDVLEHIDDDTAALKEIFRILRPNGILLLTVPAYKFLWSDHDEVLHHIRRYSKKEILVKLKMVGFEILKDNRFIMLGVIERLVSKIKNFIFSPALKEAHDFDPPAFINTLLLFILRCEKYLLRFIYLPFGTSILVVAQKRVACAKNK